MVLRRMVTVAVRGARAPWPVRALLPWLLLAGCDGGGAVPAVLAVTPGEAVIGHATVVTVRTSGYTPMPRFDLNQGAGSQDDGVQMQLVGPVTVALTGVTRRATDLFEGEVTPSQAGWYAMEATGPGGRFARLDHAMWVGAAGSFAGAVLAVDSVASDVMVVAPGQTGIAVRVTVRNLGSTPVDALVVAPVFVRGWMDGSGDFYASSRVLPVPALEGGESVVVPFLVAVQPTAASGTVTVDAMASGVEQGTDRAVGAPAAAMTTVWTVRTGPYPDAGTDAGADAGTDAGMDAGTDAGTDAGADTGMDAVAEAGMDAGADTGTDAGTDAGTDTGADTGMDTGTETGTDVASDTVADVGADAAVTGPLRVLSVTVTDGTFTEADFAVAVQNSSGGVFTLQTVEPSLTPIAPSWMFTLTDRLPLGLAPGERRDVHFRLTRGDGPIRWAVCTLDSAASGVDAAGHRVRTDHAELRTTLRLY